MKVTVDLTMEQAIEFADLLCGNSDCANCGLPHECCAELIEIDPFLALEQMGCEVK